MGSPFSPWPWLTQLSSWLPLEGEHARIGWDLLSALRAEGSQSLHPCGPLKGSQGITVWRKLPACPGEGEL